MTKPNDNRKLNAAAWFDRIIQAVCVVFMILSFGEMVLVSPFSFFIEVPFSGGSAALHTLTVFLVSLTFLFFWRKVLREVPLFYRLLLSIAFTIVGYVVYDFQWTIFLCLNTGDIPVQVENQGVVVLHTEVFWGIHAFFAALWITIPSAIILSLRHWRSKYVPRIPVKGFVLVLLFNFLLLLWLKTSDFFNLFLIYWGLKMLGFSSRDPHGWVWFFGKALGMLSWLFIFIGSRVRLKPVEKANTPYVPWHLQHRRKRK
jgi:hypothetical protein